LTAPGEVRAAAGGSEAPAAEVLEFYRTHGPITDPRGRAHLLDGLPADTASLRTIVQGLLLHEIAGKRVYGLEDGEEVSADDSRFMADLLATIVRTHDAPLTVAREPALRILTDCRNPPLLLVTMLRHLGVPARKRTGFARYIPAAMPMGMPHDVTEYWDEARRRWVLVDPGIDSVVIDRQRAYLTKRGEGWRGEYDVLDVDRGLFVFGPDLWLGLRSGSIPMGQLSVSGADQNRAGQVLLEDLDCLNKTELHGHDLEAERTADEEAEMLDGLAAVAARVDERFDEMRSAFDASEWGRVAHARVAELCR
jgi:hypothetical protein